MNFHPACLILPKMTDGEYLTLKASIRAKGFDAQKPIELFEDQILDGRHRYLACKEESVIPTFVTLTDIDPFDYVRTIHQARRSWVNQEQKALVIEELLEKSDAWQATQQRIKDEANRKRSEAAKEQHAVSNPRTGEVKPVLVEPQLEAPPNDPKQSKKFAAEKAKQIGVCRSAAERAATIRTARPDLAEKVKAGDMKPGEALRQIKKEQVAHKVGELPQGKYRVFYADPPWSYGDKCDAGGVQSGGAEKHYPSMTISELAALPVADRSADDAVLFLWVTSPLLPDGLKLATQWGFSYKSAFIWDKVRHNMGHYNSVRHELLLICVKGSCTPDVQQLFDSVQSIEKTDKHSEKPEEFRNIIDTLYPHGPRIEMFRRGEAPQGWTVWGNEAE